MRRPRRCGCRGRGTARGNVSGKPARQPCAATSVSPPRNRPVWLSSGGGQHRRRLRPPPRRRQAPRLDPQSPSAASKDEPSPVSPHLPAARAAGPRAPPCECSCGRSCVVVAPAISQVRTSRTDQPSRSILSRGDDDMFARIPRQGTHLQAAAREACARLGQPVGAHVWRPGPPHPSVTCVHRCGPTAIAERRTAVMCQHSRSRRPRNPLPSGPTLSAYPGSGCPEASPGLGCATDSPESGVRLPSVSADYAPTGG